DRWSRRSASSPVTVVSEDRLPAAVRIGLYLVLGVTVVLTVCGNVLVAISIAYFKQLHTPTNYLIASLAVSDLLLGLLVMFPAMVQCVETCWYFGDVFCDVYMSSDVMLCTASILNLSFISLDRHYAVCGRCSTGGRLNILGVEEFYYDHVACEGGCVLFQSGLSSTVSSVLSFYIPGVIMLGVYLKIYLLLDPPVVFETLVWVGYLNSTANPLIYAFFYSWFRKAFLLFTSGAVFKSDVSDTA
ncbi:hypothetical protein INR49_007867, partial [Caranx melampygus]